MAYAGLWSTAGADQPAAPRTFNVTEDARPIWSAKAPARATESSAAGAMGSAGYLRVVEATDATRADRAGVSPMPLKWRNRKSAATAQEADAGALRQSGFWSGGEVPLDGPVRPAAHQTAADPFKNPFGDRLAAADDGPLLTPSAPRQDAKDPEAKLHAPLPKSALAETPNPSRDMADEPPSRKANAVAEEPAAPPATLKPAGEDPRALFAPVAPKLTSPQTEDAAQEPATPPAKTKSAAEEPGKLFGPAAPKLTVPADDEAAPQPPAAAPAAPKVTQPRSVLNKSPLPKTEAPKPARPALDLSSPDDRRPAGDRPPSKCDRVYRDRDCCEEESKCNDVRRGLREDSIKNISLDITPTFKPDAKSAEERREASENQLRAIPSRQWRNRAGEIVADGRIVGVRSQRLMIAGEGEQSAVVPIRNLSDDDLCFLAAWWGIPTECTLGDEQQLPRTWEPTTFTWKASALCHKPLYFEERILERYGHTTGPLVAPVLSGAHFFLNVAVLPYKMGMNPPNECQYPLGYYRPGSCAPRLLPPVPISLRGGLAEAGVVTGLTFLIP